MNRRRLSISRSVRGIPYARDTHSIVLCVRGSSFHVVHVITAALTNSTLVLCLWRISLKNCKFSRVSLCVHHYYSFCDATGDVAVVSVWLCHFRAQCICRFTGGFSASSFLSRYSASCDICLRPSSSIIKGGGASPPNVCGTSRAPFMRAHRGRCPTTNHTPNEWVGDEW